MADVKQPKKPNLSLSKHRSTFLTARPTVRVGAFAVELFSFDSVHMREDQINSILSEIIKRFAFRNDVSEQSVVVFNVRLLP